MITKPERLKSDLARFKRLMKLARDFDGASESITSKVGALEDLAWRLSQDDGSISFEKLITEIITETIKEIENNEQ